jgi:hypothetical protein
MKKIFFILMGITLAMLSSCKKDKLATVAANIDAPVLHTPQADTTIVVTTTDSSQVMKIQWAKSNYGVQGINTYFVEVDSVGKNFSKKVIIGTVTNSDTLSISNGSLNDQLLAGLGLAANAPTTVELRVGSALYGKDTVYSKSVKIALTTFKALAPDKLWLPGSYQGYSPATAPTIPHVTTYYFAGFAYFSAPGNFKFTSAADYNHVNYGDGGNGTLTTDGNAGGIVYNNAGQYYLTANIQTLTDTVTYISTMGIIGPATPQGWNGSTPMTFNSATGLWTITIDLIGSNPLKFRANNDWTINFGPLNSNALSGQVTYNNAGAVTINDSGSYTITLDLTQTTYPYYYYNIVIN